MDPSDGRLFYRAGGALEHDAPSYIRRRADDELCTNLMAGRFCYVLTSRQMGKTSLMVRTRARLRVSGINAATLDLTIIGQNLKVEQWYCGLLTCIGRELELEDEMDDFWVAHEHLGPLQRFVEALLSELVPRLTSPLVIFVDEIDTVLSLPFSTDEFFAAIREFYNGRARDPRLNLLTFCLLGVATPSDLIRDPRTTPFNIGVRIHLSDFTPGEAQALAFGLGQDPRRADRLIQRVLYWTRGHPFLTQSLCLGVSQEPGKNERGSVDNACARLFLSAGQRDYDSNLNFVQKRLLHGDVDRVDVLNHYRRVARGWRRVTDDRMSPTVSVLKLSGVVRAERGVLRVRNRIYATSFDGAWIDANMPDAELRRQRSAVRRGRLQAGGFAVVIIALVVGLYIRARQESERAEAAAHLAEEQTQLARRERDRAEEKSAEAELERKKADKHRLEVVKEAGRANREAVAAEQARRRAEEEEQSARAEAERAARNLARAVASEREARAQTELARDHARRAAYYDLKDVDPTLAAVFLREISEQDKVPRWRENASEVLRRPVSRVVLGSAEARVTAAAFFPDGHVFATAFADGALRMWDVSGRALPGGCLIPGALVDRIAVSPDGRKLVAATFGGPMWSFDAEGSSAEKLPVPEGEAVAIEFGSQGNPLFAAFRNGDLWWWSSGSTGTSRIEVGVPARVVASSLAPDASMVAAARTDGLFRLLPVREKAQTSAEKRFAVRPATITFSPDSSAVAAGLEDGSLVIVSVPSGKSLSSIRAHDGAIVSLAFAPDEPLLLSASARAVRLWRWSTKPFAASRRSLAKTPGTAGLALEVAGQTLEVAGQTLEVTGQALEVAGQTLEVTGQTQDPGEATAAGPGDGVTLSLWSELPIDDRMTPLTEALLTPDGSKILTASVDGSARIWSVTGTLLGTLSGHTRRLKMAQFARDGRSLLTLSYDGSVRIWPVSESDGDPGGSVPVDETLPREELERLLEAATSVCIPVSDRRLYLVESQEEAEDRFSRCEKEHGR